MRILVDTNVILDVWLAREPFWIESARLVSCIEQGRETGILSPTTVTTLHYLGRKVLGEKQARSLLHELLQIFGIGNLTTEVFQSALQSRVADFEDAVIEAVSVANKVDLIATRNLKDFRKSRIEAKNPGQILREVMS